MKVCVYAIISYDIKTGKGIQKAEQRNWLQWLKYKIYFVKIIKGKGKTQRLDYKSGLS